MSQNIKPDYLQALAIAAAGKETLSSGTGNIRTINIYGLNAKVEATNHIVWNRQLTDYVFATTDLTMTISSTDAADTIAGPGARSIKIRGLDSNFKEIIETVEMNGQTPVTLANQYFRINELSVESAGSGNYTEGNQGNIHIGTGTVTAGIPAVTYGYMNNELAMSSIALYTVPKNKLLLLTDILYTADSGARFRYNLVYQNPNGAPKYQSLWLAYIDQNIQQHRLNVPLWFPAQTDVFFTGKKVGLGTNQGSIYARGFLLDT